MTMPPDFKLPMQPLQYPLKIHAIDGSPTGQCEITHCSELLHLQVQVPRGLLVTTTTGQPIILAFPWMQQHNPLRSWQGKEFIRLSEFYQKHCLELHCTPLASNSVKSPKTQKHVNILKANQERVEVFSKAKVTWLAPNQPYYCVIYLIPCAKTETSIPFLFMEQHTMEEYIQETLQQGYICTFTTPDSACFFFIEKKAGGLKPCIDYQGLKQITIKYLYPLRLVPPTLEQLHSATVFIKLDLRSN